jgi:hypothetical protein
MKRLAIAAVAILALIGLLASIPSASGQGSQLNALTTNALRSKAWTLNGLWTFISGFNSRANYYSGNLTSLNGAGGLGLEQQIVDGRITDPVAAPTITGQTGASGCTNGQSYKTGIVYYSPGGTSLLGTMSNAFTVTGSNANIVVAQGTAPTAATAYRVWWASAADGYSTKKSCSLAGGVFNSISVPTFNCGCSGSGIAPPGANTTAALSAFSFTDGTIKAASYGASPQFLMTADRNLLTLSGAIPTWSPDSGTTTVPILTGGTQIKTVCASGCSATTVAGGLALATSPTSSNRYTIVVYPGVYNEAVTVPTYTSLFGTERSSTIVRKVGTAVGAQEVTISNMTIVEAILPGTNRTTPANLYLVGVDGGAFNCSTEYGLACGAFTGSIDFINGSTNGSDGGGNTIFVWATRYRGTWDAFALGPDDSYIGYGNDLDLRGTSSTDAARCWNSLTGSIRVKDSGSRCSATMSDSTYGSFGYVAAIQVDNSRPIGGTTASLPSLIDLAGTQISVSTTNGSLTGTNRQGVILIDDVLTAGGAGTISLKNVTATVTAADASQTIDGIHLASDAQLSGWTAEWRVGSLALSGGATRNDVRSDEATVTSITLDRLLHSGVYSGAGTAPTIVNSPLIGGGTRDRAIATAPANCVVGDHYTDTSGADCVCLSAGTWTKTVGAGTCV